MSRSHSHEFGGDKRWTVAVGVRSNDPEIDPYLKLAGRVISLAIIDAHPKASPRRRELEPDLRQRVEEWFEGKSWLDETHDLWNRSFESAVAILYRERVQGKGEEQ